MRFIKRKFSKINKRTILSVSICLVIFVMSLGYAALSQHMDIDGVAQIDRSWIIKITGITSTVTNGGVDKSKTYVSTTATLNASLPTKDATVTYSITLANDGNIPAKLSTIEKIEDENYAITYEIEGVLEDTTVLKPDETVVAKVTIKAQDGVENLSALDKSIMLTFNFIEKSGNNGNNSGDSTSQSTIAYQPGDAILLDPGDGTTRLFYVISTDDNSSKSTVTLICNDSIMSAPAETAASAASGITNWSVASSKRLPTMDEVAALSGYTMSQLNKNLGRTIIPEWLAGSTTGMMTATSSTNGDEYYVISNTGKGMNGVPSLQSASTMVSVRPVIEVYKVALPSYNNGYGEYTVGDKVKLVDGSNWYVVKNTGKYDAMVTLYSDYTLTTRAFDTSTTSNGKYDPNVSTNIGYYMENTALQTITHPLGLYNGSDLTGVTIRIPTEEEAVNLYNIDDTLFAGASPTWVLPSATGGHNNAFYMGGGITLSATTTGVQVRPVITVLKSNIQAIDAGYKIANLFNTPISDNGIDFYYGPTSSTSSAGYKEKSYGSTSTISFTASTTYYFGKSYKFDSSTGYYSLNDTTSSTWSNMSSNYSKYPYTCKATSSTGNCTTLYKMVNHSSSTTGYAYTYTRMSKGLYFKETTSSTTTTIGASVPYKYGTSYTFDNSTGVYSLSGTISTVTGSNVSSSAPYTCRNNYTTTCTSLYQITGQASGSTTSFEVTLHSTSRIINTADKSNGIGLFYTSTNTEGNKKTYYFRGQVDNYIKFGGFYWSIIRINEDGSIRLIYLGTDGRTYNIADDQYNIYPASRPFNAYIGYMFGTAGATTYANEHANTYNSSIKTALDTWYKNNLISYANNIVDAGFCNDRSIASASKTWNSNDTALGYGSNTTYYGATNRLINNSHPQFKCPQTNDLFTTAKSGSGNKKLTYPIGLITADEANYAGLSRGGNIDHYLFTGASGFWTMTPYYTGNMFGAVSGATLQSAVLTSTYGIRPVINVSPYVKNITGIGTFANPYVLNY